MERKDTIRDGIADVVNRVDPSLAIDIERDSRASLRLIEITAELSAEVNETLRGAVDSARAAGLSWEQIGDALSVSRQAAQQRFRRDLPASDGAVWRMTPVTSFDEIARLNEAGRYGWHSVGFGALFHDLVRTGEQWEHRRVGILSSRQAREDEGWQKIGSMWFPWVYYARPTGVEALTGEAPELRRG